MAAFLLDWLNLLVRWTHMVLGIAWIGASFHFVWLDFSFRRRERMNAGVSGTSWMVHGGGFYHVEKYLVAPPSLPGDLHWFKWEAYLTWFTGMVLLAVQYYWNADAFLIDPSVLALTPGGAIVLSLVTLIAGWVIYDALCRSPIGKKPGLLVACVFLLVVGAAYLFTHIFSGRGALIHIGAFMGTIMAANVFMIIIPNQSIMVGQLMRGEAPNPEFGRIGKQRSLHNNYLTLPVLLMMISNHYPFLTGHSPWLVVALVLVIGALIRHMINRGDAGEPFEKHSWALPVAAVALLAAIFVTAPHEAPAAAATASTVPDSRMLALVGTHCTACHAARPGNTAFASPPKGIDLTSLAGIQQHAAQIKQFAVVAKVMPLGNTTHITDAERAEMGAWIDGQK